jgi:isoleucyl-tRNA synthetase
LDLALTPELLAEGYARDVIRDVQDARKGAGLDVADRINLTLTVPEEYAPAVEANRELIMSETLVLTLSVVADAVDERAVAVKKAEA